MGGVGVGGIRLRCSRGWLRGRLKRGGRAFGERAETGMAAVFGGLDNPLKPTPPAWTSYRPVFFLTSKSRTFHIDFSGSKQIEEKNLVLVGNLSNTRVLNLDLMHFRSI